LDLPKILQGPLALGAGLSVLLTGLSEAFMGVVFPGLTMALEASVVAIHSVVSLAVVTLAVPPAAATSVEEVADNRQG
jgi:hypothetical protein